jgi:hypothetical protein
MVQKSTKNAYSNYTSYKLEEKLEEITSLNVSLEQKNEKIHKKFVPP